MKKCFNQKYVFKRGKFKTNRKKKLPTKKLKYCQSLLMTPKLNQKNPNPSQHSEPSITIVLK